MFNEEIPFFFGGLVPGVWFRNAEAFLECPYQYSKGWKKVTTKLATQSWRRSRTIQNVYYIRYLRVFTMKNYPLLYYGVYQRATRWWWDGFWSSQMVNIQTNDPCPRVYEPVLWLKPVCGSFQQKPMYKNWVKIQLGTPTCITSHLGTLCRWERSRLGLWIWGKWR